MNVGQWVAIAGLGAIAALVAIAVCFTGRDPSGGLRASLPAAIDQVRADFNRGDCTSILQNASKAFRVATRIDLDGGFNFQMQCEFLRLNVGEWKSFAPEQWSRRGSRLEMDGWAAFEKGERRILSAWVLEGGHARLFGLSILDSQAARPPFHARAGLSFTMPLREPSKPSKAVPSDRDPPTRTWLNLKNG